MPNPTGSTWDDFTSTTPLGAQLGGGATGSIPRSGVCFSGGVNVCVYGLCMGFGVHTALLAFRQLSSVTEGVQAVLEDW